MLTDVTPRFRIGHVLFIDVVGYSKLLVNDQTRLVRRLNELVQGTEQVRLASKKNKLLRVATGDGMALVFRDSPESPVRCALELSQVLKKQTPPIPVRMGIHSGLLNEVMDVNNRMNVTGAGINIAQRVMDCGDARHILLSKHVAEDLEHDERWRPCLHDLGQCEVKHGLRVELVNLYNSEAGNPELPEKIRRTRRKRVATSMLVLSGAGILGLLVLGSSWFVTAHFQKPNDDQLMSVAASTPAATPKAPTMSTPDLTLANTTLSNSVWPQPLHIVPTSRAPKLFAGTWRGTVHSVGPQSTWDSQIELSIDQSETHWSNMSGGSVSRQGRTLSYKRSYRLGRSTSVQVQASLTVNEDGSTAAYSTSQVSVTGKSASKTSGEGILEKVQ
ncbi:MAG TPA: adenylate/guanylate cyclase domain-containing protein [Candidatus Udaeobacter sp.]|jgi:class 3 adenylate cyclase